MTAGKRAAGGGLARSRPRSGPAWPGEDHGQVIAPLGQLLVQAVEHLLAAIGQAAPGVRIGDHHDPPAARRTVSPTKTPVSRRVAPAMLAAATSSTCPDDSSPSSA